jgi:hypothetical protein
MSKETPLLTSDILSPATHLAKHGDKASAIQDSNIPILSWARGSPFDAAKAVPSSSKTLRGLPGAEILSPTNMEHYFCASDKDADAEDRQEFDGDDADVDDGTAHGSGSGAVVPVVKQRLEYGGGGGDGMLEESPTTKSEMSFGGGEPVNPRLDVDTTHDDSGVVEEESAVVFGRNYTGGAEDGDDDDDDEDDEGEEVKEDDNLVAAALAAAERGLSSSLPSHTLGAETPVDEAHAAGDDDDDDDEGEEGDEDGEEEYDDEYNGYDVTDFDRLSQGSLATGSDGVDFEGSTATGTRAQGGQDAEYDDDDDEDDEGEGDGAGAVAASADALEGTLASYLGLMHGNGDAVNVLDDKVTPTLLPPLSGHALRYSAAWLHRRAHQ